MSSAVKIERLNRTDAPDYADLVKETEHALLYQTPEWLAFLQLVSAGSEPVMFIARENCEAVGSFAAFLKRGPFGVALNALPYFGAHGDFLISPKAIDPSATEATLVRALRELLREADVKAVNIVAHPFTPRIGAVAGTLGLRAWDRRIGQISTLSLALSREEAVEAVLAACKQKTRNLVRKAIRQNFTVERSESEADWGALIAHHRIGIERIGGQAKSPEEFAALRACFTSGTQRRLYVARRGGRFAGGLLCFYCRDWVEYFTPVVVEEFRSEQVLSALIVEALIEARLEGRRFWNWGGTWTSQTGVYHFKQGWGAVDHIYDYYGDVSEVMAGANPGDLRIHYPFFYIRPYSSAAAAR